MNTYYLRPFRALAINPRFLCAVVAVLAFLPAGLRAQPASANVPLHPVEQSPLVIKSRNGALIVAKKNGSGIDGIKLSQHDREIGSPSIAVAPDGTIHVAFMEGHRTSPFAHAIYHRSSRDGGKTWTEAKNLTEDLINIDVGRCQVVADSRNRVYVIWQAALQEGWMISSAASGSHGNLCYRELEGGKWSRTQAVSFPCVGNAGFNDAALSFFAVLDAAGRAQVLWNVQPDKWHPELLTGNPPGHSPGVGSGLVFQSTLDGAAPGKPREVFLPAIPAKVHTWDPPSCEGLDTINGYVDAAGAAHFVGAVEGLAYSSNPHKPYYQLMENGKAGEIVKLPDLSFHAAKDVPTLLLDAKGKRHLIALFLGGEHSNVRDYPLGSQDEPTVIRAATGLNATIDGFQAYQGPGGRMVALIQMNDTGERSTDENYVSISTGDGKWSIPVNTSNNAGRKTYVIRNTTVASAVSRETGCQPGPGAAAFDKEGHLLLVTINQEYGIVHSTALGVVIAGGGSLTPTLRFLKF